MTVYEINYSERLKKYIYFTADLDSDLVKDFRASEEEKRILEEEFDIEFLPDTEVIVSENYEDLIKVIAAQKLYDLINEETHIDLIDTVNMLLDNKEQEYDISNHYYAVINPAASDADVEFIICVRDKDTNETESEYLKFNIENINKL